jgi:hypothetical protein
VSKFAKRRKGFVFRLSERASVRIVIARRSKGRYRTKGTLTRRRLQAGKHTIAFRGRLAGKKLAPGRYRATLIATDAAGNRSSPERLPFRVKKR